MCMIFASDTGILPNKGLVRAAIADNPDGGGVCWNEDGKLRLFKSEHSWRVLEWLGRAEGHPYILHLRYATSGEKDARTAHPFLVHDAAFAHNGVMHIAQEFGESDTQALARFLKDHPATLDHLRDDKQASTYFADKAFNSSRYAFLWKDGRMVTIGGKWDKGVWYSKTQERISKPLEDQKWYYELDSRAADRKFTGRYLSGRIQ